MLELGTLTVRLAADIDQLKKDFAKAQRETKRAADEASKLSRQFAESFGAIQTVSTRLAGNFNLLGESFAKVFGESGSKGARKIADDLGLSVSAVDGVATGLKGLGGAFSAAAVGAQLLIGPFGAMLAMTLGIVGGWGAIKKAIGESKIDQMKDNFSLGADYIFGGKEGRSRVYAEMRPDLAQEYQTLKNQLATDGMLTGDSADRLTYLSEYLSGLETAQATQEQTIDLGKAFMESLKSGAEDFKGVIATVGEMFQKAPKQSDASKALATGAKDGRDALLEAFGAVEHELRIEAEDRAAALATWKKGEADWQRAHEESVKRLIDRNTRLAAAEAASWQQAIGKDASRIGRLSVSSSAGQTAASEADVRAFYDAIASGQLGSAIAGSDKRTIGTNVLDQVGSAAMSQSRYTSAAAQGAAQGGQMGGPWGAVIGAVIGLITQSEGFAKAMGAFEDVLGGLAEALGGIVGALAPIIKTAAQPIMVIIGVITQIASIFGALISALDSFLSMTFLFDMGLRPVVFALNALSAVLKLLESGLHWAAYGIKVAYNGILEAIADVVGVFSDDAADRLRAAKADTQASRDAATAAWDAFKDAWSWQMFEMPSAAESVDLLSDSATDAARSLQRFSDGILNAAPGYKMGGAMFSAAADVGGPPVQQNVTININGSGDPEQTWNKIKRVMERENFLRGATTIARAPAFAGS